MAEQARTAAVTESVEFKAAVAAEVARVTGPLLKDEVAKVIEALKGSGESKDSIQLFADSLALSMARMSEQTNGRKYVDPRVLAERTKARERMFELIIAARRERRIPSYRVQAKTLLDNQVVEPFWVDKSHVAQPTEIDWPGVPNDAMVPLNDTAKEIHVAFLDSVGSRPESTLPGLTDATLDPEYGVTAGGLVVKSGAIPRQGRRPSEGRTLADLGGEGLSLHHKNEPGRFVEKRVLGTIAEPARQTV